MTNKSIDNILQPSLADEKPISKSYSVIAHMLVAWFGGPVGASLFSIINLQQMGVAKRYKATCTALFVLSLVAILLLVMLLLGKIQLPDALILGDIQGTAKTMMRLFGILIYGSFYLAFRQYYIASDQIESEEPSAWKVGLACALMGGMIIFATSALFI